jgi:hypothetical protein
MRVRFISAFFVCALCLLLIQIPTIRAGSLTIAPSTIYGTAISFSASYPDFHFDESPNVSLTISATFNNASISAISITAIYIRLYDPNVNVTYISEEYPPTVQEAYAWGGWYSTDEWGSNAPANTPQPYKIQRLSVGETQSLDVNPVTLYGWYYTALDKEVQARLYVEITLCFLDVNGSIIWRQGTNFWQVGYHWHYFTGAGEAPYVTVSPKAQQQSWLLRPEIIALVVGLVGLVLVITAVIVMRRKRTKTLRKDTHSPPPPQPTS